MFFKSIHLIYASYFLHNISVWKKKSMIESSFYSLQNIKVIQGDFSSIYEWKKIYIYFSVNFHKRKISKTSTSRYFFFGGGGDKLGSWVSYGSWIYNYLCNQCLSPPKLLVRIPPMVCQWFATSQWFSLSTPVTSSNKTDHHDIWRHNRNPNTFCKFRKFISKLMIC